MKLVSYTIITINVTMEKWCSNRDSNNSSHMSKRFVTNRQLFSMPCASPIHRNDSHEDVRKTTVSWHM